MAKEEEGKTFLPPGGGGGGVPASFQFQEKLKRLHSARSWVLELLIKPNQI